MASIRQVARDAGVSVATVSRVLNGATTVRADLRERVLQAAGAAHYTPSVGKRAHERIAFIYTGDFYLEAPYDASCIEGFGRAMRRSPYDLTLLDITRDRIPGETLSQFFARKGVCGAVIRGVVEHREHVIEMSAEGPPLVVIGDHFESDVVRFVYSDSRGASRDAVEHLISLGHERIAFVGCDRDDGDHGDRLEAYRTVVGEAGLLREDDVYRVPAHRMDGVPLVRRIFSTADRPTALFVADPLIAVGIINEAHELGAVIPDDLSVVGVDDTDMRNTVYPQMSAVCQDSPMIGEIAFDTVRALVEGFPGPDALPAPEEAWFEIHHTTAPPPETVRRFLTRRRS